MPLRTGGLCGGPVGGLGCLSSMIWLSKGPRFIVRESCRHFRWWQAFIKTEHFPGKQKASI